MRFNDATRNGLLFMMVLAFFASITTAAAQSLTETDAPRVTDRAPALELEHMLQAPIDADELSMASLRGKVVVLEFWATWCGPCVGAIPHVNKLVEYFQDEPVRFISITDEKRETIEDFLSRKKMKTWIGLDTDRSMFSAYHIRGIPQMILIDKDGRIAAMAHPMAVQTKHIQRVLDGELPDFGRGDVNRTERVAAQPSGVEPVFSITIRPGSGNTSGMSGGPGKVEFNNRTLRSIITWAWNTTESRLDAQFDRLDEQFDVTVIAPRRARDSVRNHLRYALQAAFGLEVEKVTRQTDVYVLKHMGRPAPDLDRAAADSGGFMSTGAGRINMAGVQLDALVMALEGVLDRPVVDETELDGRFDVLLEWDAGRTASLKKALRDRLGLRLVKAARPVQYTVVRGADDVESSKN